MSEFIYILENPSFDGVVKIGRTARDVAERVKELSSLNSFIYFHPSTRWFFF